MEVASNSCISNNLAYSDCIIDPDFISEARFTILEPGGSIPVEGGKPILSNSSYPPITTILSPTKGSIFSRTGTIRYSAIDWNDSNQPFPKDYAGLGPNPVSLFYSDKLGDNMYTLVDPKLKTPIASGLIASSSYVWTTPDLIPGNFYRIVADAIDLEGLTGEAVSDPFTVDFTPPVFTVKTDPLAVRRGTVAITIDSSKDLPAPPLVTVRQYGAEPVTLNVSGNAGHFIASYTVIPDHDGTAHISVTGTDAAGNISTTTVSGGTFSVGVNPPPAPTIVSPAAKTAVASDHIDVRGTARDDTTVLLQVNGADAAETKPDSDGNFIFKGVALDKSKNHGINYLSVSSRDAFGVVGPAAESDVKWNVPPTITLVKPVRDEVVSDQENIAVNGADENGDSLFYTYQIQPGRNPIESAWTPIGEAVPSSGYIWNATEVDDGEYSLRVIVDDGYAKATSSIVRFTVRNTVPFFRFEDGRKTVTRDGAPTLVGRALTSNNVGIRPNVNSAEYSLDRGTNWLPIKFLDTFGSLSERRFSLALPAMKEGTYPILFRVTDARGTMGKAVHPVTIDRTAPAAPQVSSVRSGAMLTDANDQSPDSPGMQTGLAGTAEPGSMVSLSYDGATTTAKALANGTFDFGSVTFLAKGIHALSLTATDEAGNMSKPYKMTLVYDNPPVITLINPKPFHGLSGQTDIKWSIKDADGDQLGDTTVSYRIYGGAWKTIADHVAAIGDVPFDASKLTQANDYELRISTTDGIMPVSLIASFSVDDVAPVVESLSADTSVSSGSIGLSASGIATDDVSGVEYVEYAISSGMNEAQPDGSWYRALIAKGFNTTRASYSIRYPLLLDDGSYTISVRAIDSAGNVSKPISRQVRIDRTAPRVGSFFLETDGVRLPPDDSGAVSIPAHSPVVFSISLEGDTSAATLAVGSSSFLLSHDLATGLWTASIPPDTATSTSRLAISSSDQSGNAFMGKELGTLKILDRGLVYAVEGSVHTPVGGAHIRVLKLSEETRSYAPYMTGDGVALSTDTGADGSYDLTLPQGKYRLIVTAPGMKTLEQDISLDIPGFIGLPFATQPISGFGALIQAVVDWFR